MAGSPEADTLAVVDNPAADNHPSHTLINSRSKQMPINQSEKEKKLPDLIIKNLDSRLERINRKRDEESLKYLGEEVRRRGVAAGCSSSW